MRDGGFGQEEQWREGEGHLGRGSSICMKEPVPEGGRLVGGSLAGGGRGGWGGGGARLAAAEGAEGAWGAAYTRLCWPG